MKNLVKFTVIILLSMFFTSCKKDEKVSTSKQVVNNPVIKVIDTDFSKGRLALEHTITLKDVEKFHGHLCDGLVVGFLGLKQAFKVLYPSGIIDRTNTRIVTKSSPCLTDVAAYLTGGRYQFNTYYVSNDIKGLFVVQRIDNHKTVVVNLKKGLSNPKMNQLGSLAVKGQLSACGLDSLKVLEKEFSAFLLKTNPKDNFIIAEITDFKWQPVLKNDFLKTDVINKNKPQCNL